jgi:hypothetical protein
MTETVVKKVEKIDPFFYESEIPALQRKLSIWRLQELKMTAKARCYCP